MPESVKRFAAERIKAPGADAPACRNAFDSVMLFALILRSVEAEIFAVAFVNALVVTLVTNPPNVVKNILVNRNDETVAGRPRSRTRSAVRSNAPLNVPMQPGLSK